MARALESTPWRALAAAIAKLAELAKVHPLMALTITTERALDALHLI